MGNIGGGFGDFAGGLISPISQLADVATGVFNSPFTYLLLPIVGVVVITMVVKGAQTAQVVAQNPDSIRAVVKQYYKNELKYYFCNSFSVFIKN